MNISRKEQKSTPEFTISFNVILVASPHPPTQKKGGGGGEKITLKCLHPGSSHGGSPSPL